MFLKNMYIFWKNHNDFWIFSKIYWENGRSRSRIRNFWQSGAGTAQKWTGPTTLLKMCLSVLFRRGSIRIPIASVLFENIIVNSLASNLEFVLDWNQIPLVLPEQRPYRYEMKCRQKKTQNKGIILTFNRFSADIQTYSIRTLFFSR
jgi:hypothetical protein